MHRIANIENEKLLGWGNYEIIKLVNIQIKRCMYFKITEYTTQRESII